MTYGHIRWGVSSKGPYSALPNRDTTTATLIAHYLTRRLHLPYLACSSHSLPDSGATITWTTRGYGQDCRKRPSGLRQEESGSGLAAPCSRWLWL